MMSPNQVRVSISESDNYALCYVDMIGFKHPNISENISYNIDDISNRISCLPNIGSLNKDFVNIVNYNSEDNDEKIHIGGDYKIIVPQKIIKENAKSLEDLIAIIIDKIHSSEIKNV